MKKLLLALALLFLPTAASAACTGIFAAGSICGSITGGPPMEVPSTSFGGLIPANSVTNSLLAPMPANTVKCNPTGSLANPQDCSGTQIGNLLGNNTITNAMLAPMLANSFKCNPTGSPANAQDCTSLPSGLFANPTATIGLTAINGVATTPPRSDSAPALSQAIAPTWTGTHTFTAGEVFTGSPAFSTTWPWGGVSINAAITTSGGTTAGGINAGSSTVPEIIAQFGMTSALGSANASTAYKIAFSSWMVANSGSANAYGGNPVCQQGSGFSTLSNCWEIDDNNVSGTDFSFTSLGTSTSIVSLVLASGGTNWESAAMWVIGVGASKNFGNGIVGSGANTINTITGAFIRDSTNSNTIIQATGTHQYGIQMHGASISTAAMTIPNTAPIEACAAGCGSLISMLFLDSGNKMQYGSASVIEHSFTVNPAGATAAMLLVNSHATAGDQGLVIAAGSTGTADTSTLYMSFNDSSNATQAGGIVRADAAGVRHVTYNTASDARLKRSLGLFNGALDRLMTIEVHRYVGTTYHGDDFDVGFFAQNLYRAFPWAVTPSTDPDFRKHPWTVDYGHVTPLLVAAAQEMQHEIDRLSSRVAELEHRGYISPAGSQRYN